MNTSYVFNVGHYGLLLIIVLQPLLFLWLKGVYLICFLAFTIIVLNDYFRSPRRQLRLYWPTNAFLIAAFYSLPVISFIWSHFPKESFVYGALALFNVIVFYLALRAGIHQPGRLVHRIVLLLPLATLLTFTIILAVFGSVRPSGGAMRDAVGSYSNVGSALTVVCLPYFILFSKLWRRSWLYWLSYASIFLVVILSASRSAIILVLLSYVLSLLIIPAKNKFKLKLLLLWSMAFVVLSAGYYLVASELPFSDQISRLTGSQVFDLNKLSEPDKLSSDYRRAIMYAAGIQAIGTEPLSGIGYHSLKPFMEQMYPTGLVSHNIIVSVWGELGVIGMFAFSILTFFIFSRLNRVIKAEHLSERIRVYAVATTVALVLVYIQSFARPFFTNYLIPILYAQVFVLLRAYRSSYEENTLLEKGG